MIDGLVVATVRRLDEQRVLYEPTPRKMWQDARVPISVMTLCTQKVHLYMGGKQGSRIERCFSVLHLPFQLIVLMFFQKGVTK